MKRSDTMPTQGDWTRRLPDVDPLEQTYRELITESPEAVKDSWRNITPRCCVIDLQFLDAAAAVECSPMRKNPVFRRGHRILFRALGHQ